MGSLRDLHKQEDFLGPGFEDDPALPLIQTVQKLFGLHLYQSKWNRENNTRFVSFRIDFPTITQKLDVLMNIGGYPGGFPWQVRFYEKLYPDNKEDSNQPGVFGKPKKEFTVMTSQEFSDQLKDVCQNWNTIMRSS